VGRYKRLGKPGFQARDRRRLMNLPSIKKMGADQRSIPDPEIRCIPGTYVFQPCSAIYPDAAALSTPFPIKADAASINIVSAIIKPRFP
jgi:hypothetical protein